MIDKFEKIKLAMFTDDTVIYAYSFSAIIVAKQIQINILQKYYEKWKILLNAVKTKTKIFYIIFSRKIKDSRVIQPIKTYNQQTSCKNT